MIFLTPLKHYPIKKKKVCFVKKYIKYTNILPQQYINHNLSDYHFNHCEKKSLSYLLCI